MGGIFLKDVIGEWVLSSLEYSKSAAIGVKEASENKPFSNDKNLSKLLKVMKINESNADFLVKMEQEEFRGTLEQYTTWSVETQIM